MCGSEGKNDKPIEVFLNNFVSFDASHSIKKHVKIDQTLLFAYDIGRRSFVQVATEEGESS
jgi:hypothetical protein